MGGAAVAAVLVVAGLLLSGSQAASEQEQPSDEVLQAVTLLQGASGHRGTSDKGTKRPLRGRPPTPFNNDNADGGRGRGRGGGGGGGGDEGGGGGKNDEVTTPSSTFGLRERVVSTAATTQPPAKRERTRTSNNKKEPQPKRQEDILKVRHPKRQEDIPKLPQPKRQKEISEVLQPNPQKEISRVPQPSPQKEISRVPQPSPQKEISRVPQPSPQKEISRVPQPSPQKEISRVPQPSPQKEISRVPQPSPQKEISRVPQPSPQKEISRVLQSKRHGDISKVPQPKRQADISKEPQSTRQRGKPKAVESQAAGDEVVVSTTFRNGSRGRARVVKVKRPVSGEAEGRELEVKLEKEVEEEKESEVKEEAKEEMDLSVITPSNVDLLGTWGRRLAPLESKSHSLKPLAVSSETKKTQPPRTRRPARRPSTFTTVSPTPTTTTEPEATTYRPTRRPNLFPSRRRGQNNRNRLTPHRNGTRTPPKDTLLGSNTEDDDEEDIEVLDDVPRLPQVKPLFTPTPPPFSFLTPRPTPLPLPQVPTATPGFFGQPVITTHRPPITFTTPGTLGTFTSLPGTFTSPIAFVTTPFTPLRLTPSSVPVVSSPFSSPRPFLFTPSVTTSPFASVTPSIFTAISPAVPPSPSLSSSSPSLPSPRAPFISSNPAQFPVSSSPQLPSSFPSAFTTTNSPSFSTPRPLLVTTSHPAFVTTSRPSFFTTPRPSFFTTSEPSFNRIRRPNIVNSSGHPSQPSTPRPFSSQLENSNPGLSSFFESSRTQSQPHELSGRQHSVSTQFGNTPGQQGRPGAPTSFVTSHQSPPTLQPVPFRSLPSAGVSRPSQSPFHQTEFSSPHRVSPTSPSFSPTPTPSRLGFTSFPSAFVFHQPTTPTPRPFVTVSTPQPSFRTPENHVDPFHFQQDGGTDPFSFLKTEHQQNTNFLPDRSETPPQHTSSVSTSSPMAPFFRFFSTRPPRAPSTTLPPASASHFSGSFQSFNVPTPASHSQPQDTIPDVFPHPTTQTPTTVLSPVNLLPQDTFSPLKDSVNLNTAPKTPLPKPRAPPPASPFFSAFGSFLPGEAGQGPKDNFQTKVTTTNIRPPRQRPLPPTTSRRQDGPHPDTDALPPPPRPPLSPAGKSDDEIMRSLSQQSSVTGKSYIFFRTGNNMYQVVWQ
ncbi:uncharacterized protein LOC127001278 isoform X2 [Eriocheir sinensis]|uniref:uncharacterized protein LOC127001278 isoform X2 n=1 Tax=Eriocheir sinensis TaxID=95602 RepID=UPI0021CA61C9|nr:uncharacterized protein LOC127001278 isoform X2 [Eriocheir sinensis]